MNSCPLQVWYVFEKVQDMEEESSSEDEESHRPPSRTLGTKVTTKVIGSKDIAAQPVPLPPTLDKVVIKKGYDPKQGEINQIKLVD